MNSTENSSAQQLDVAVERSSDIRTDTSSTQMHQVICHNCNKRSKDLEITIAIGPSTFYSHNICKECVANAMNFMTFDIKHQCTSEIIKCTKCSVEICNNCKVFVKVGSANLHYSNDKICRACAKLIPQNIL